MQERNVFIYKWLECVEIKLNTYTRKKLSSCLGHIRRIDDAHGGFIFETKLAVELRSSNTRKKGDEILEHTSVVTTGNIYGKRYKKKEIIPDSLSSFQ